jgi:hypothetical protein
MIYRHRFTEGSQQGGDAGLGVSAAARPQAGQRDQGNKPKFEDSHGKALQDARYVDLGYKLGRFNTNTSIQLRRNSVVD